MHDLISRQAAIDEAEEWIEVVYCEDGDQRERDAIGHVIHGIKELPTVHTCEDAVSRWQAIDALAEQMPQSFTPDGSHPADEGIFRAQEIYADCIQTLKELSAVQPQPEEDCDTCKHGYFGDRQCDNCRVRYPSHYEREDEQHGKNT